MFAANSAKATASLTTHLASSSAAAAAASSQLIHTASTNLVAKLSDDERKQLLPDLESAGWCLQDGRDAIEKQFLFDDFVQAWSFMSKTAEYAEQVQHHPEWFNVYNRVDVTLSTHDADGLSHKDYDAARKMDEFAAEVTQ